MYFLDNMQNASFLVHSADKLIQLVLCVILHMYVWLAIPVRMEQPVSLTVQATLTTPARALPTTLDKTVLVRHSSYSI